MGLDDCEVCQNRPCKNGGTCTEVARDRGFVCHCKPGYTGMTCRGVGQRCYPGACNKGRCLNTGESGFQCLCPVGFTGKRCEEGERSLARGGWGWGFRPFITLFTESGLNYFVDFDWYINPALFHSNLSKNSL